MFVRESVINIAALFTLIVTPLATKSNLEDLGVTALFFIFAMTVIHGMFKLLGKKQKTESEKIEAIYQALKEVGTIKEEKKDDN